jgi:cell division protein FtsB
LRPRRKKLWTFLFIAFCLLGPVLGWLGFGKQGFINLHRIEKEREAFADRIRQLKEENRLLLRDIGRLRTDMSYVEYVARTELNLIKENEIIYRFRSAEPDNRGVIKTSHESHRDGNHKAGKGR